MRPAHALVILTAACAADTGALTADGPDLSRQGELLPDFTLQDRNPTSATSKEMVSVSDQRGRVSAWYFGHST